MKSDEHKRLCRECFDRRDDLRNNDCLRCEQDCENFQYIIDLEGEMGVVDMLTLTERRETENGNQGN